jgi:hypothetical protein
LTQAITIKAPIALRDITRHAGKRPGAPGLFSFQMP